MGIYSSNSYNPLGSIQAALNNVNEHNRIKNEYWKRKGEIWSNFANQMGKIGGRVIDGLTAGSESNGSLEARLAALEAELKEAEEAERVQAIQDKYNEQVAQRNSINNYLMQADHGTDIFRRPEVSQIGSGSINPMEGYMPNPNMDEYAQYLRNSMGGLYRR